MDSVQSEYAVGGHAAGRRSPRGRVGVRWRMPVSSTFMDRYAEQGYQSTHMKDGAQALAHEQMSIVDGEISPPCTTVCSSGATVKSWLATVARGRLQRSVLSALVMYKGTGTKRTHAIAAMSTLASESSGPIAAMAAEIAVCCRVGGVTQKRVLRYRKTPG